MSVLDKMAEILECSPKELNGSVAFRDHPHWDSLAAISTIAMADADYGVELSPTQFEQLETIDELDACLRKQSGI
ncbi:MAG: acyl carrier protein [Chromatiales bacterium]|nr:acyl carrier protein [Chromatiales bacterium]